jgi:hypothetical protein
MKKTVSGIAVFLITGIVLIISLQRPNRIKSIEPIDRGVSNEKPSDRVSKSQHKPSFRPSTEQNKSTFTQEATHSTPLQIIEEVGQQFPQYVEIKKILTGYDVCRTNPELAHRLTFETYADLENAHTAANDAFSDILWAEQTAQNRQFGSGSEMANPTNNPSILRAVERISEARQHRAMAIERLERFGIPLSGADRLSLLTTEPKEPIWIMKDLVPKVGGLGD